MYKFTNQTKEVRNVEINLRHESSILTDEFGIKVLYARNCKYVRCKCFNDLNKNGDPDCPLCFGSGHFASLEKISAIESSDRPYRYENYLKGTDIGTMEQENDIYYIQYPFVPKERDYILKTTWDKYGNPVDIIQVGEILSIYEMRGDNGRVELNGCVTFSRPELIPIFNKTLKSLPKKALIPLLNGGKTIWPHKLLNYHKMKEIK